AAGQPVGRVGLSGRTEFPHVHLTVRRDGVAVDPFHPDPAATCDAAPAVTLWSDPPPYRPGGLIGLGVAVAPPDFEAVKAGLPETPALPRDAPALIVWAHLFGVRAGDRLLLRLIGPDGAVVDHGATLARTQARAMRFAGRRMPAAGWPPGTYAAHADLTRDGAVIERMAASVTIAP
ncbi:MAG: M23 family peptidase, partial [Gemmobacter sp.]